METYILAISPVFMATVAVTVPLVSAGAPQQGASVVAKITMDDMGGWRLEAREREVEGPPVQERTDPSDQHPVSTQRAACREYIDISHQFNEQGDRLQFTGNKLKLKVTFGGGGRSPQSNSCPS